ncbi:transcription antitermination factor NusB [Sansalvadorimonas sp. 2012CJ34-2]|uniref:Transcription antitermination protein NusB n=1 Tax=Parendozoicomonas callyspongiae TaxID=2942213 RepID=A0ABT0PHJ3_9GAMM|nr:transcription antitermination factor NusB [Sansalvadorimonas sp. 2012CJ34-2]MCL6270476.1 transcription antitermination factor NusB [Sansalvadorimonas sp. 2012CJ34-2]
MSAESNNAGQKNRGRTQTRRKARELALQALYQWHMAGSSITDIEAQFRARNDMTKVDGGFFRELLLGVAQQASELDETLSPVLDRDLEKLDPVEKAALRLGCYELKVRTDVPYRVVINEGIELAKKFGAQDSHKYINGILDKLALNLRAVEVKEYRNRRQSR